MAQSTQGWPFLVARGRRRGYRTILAPAFLTERRFHGLLADSADGAQMKSGRPRQVELNHPDVGRLTLVYRTEQVTAAEVQDGRGEGLATDQHGRPLEILYGVVCSGRLRGRVEDADLGMARAEAIESYRRFLTDEDAFGVAASEPFPLRDVTVAEDDEPPPSADPLPDPAPRSVPVRRTAAFAAVGLAVVLAVMLLLMPGGTPHIERIQASMTPSAGAIDCASPMTVELRGAVTMDGGGDVVYHWESGDWRSESGRLAFKDADTLQLPVEHHVTAPVPADGYTLVVEAPQRKSAEAAHELRCVAPANVNDTPPSRDLG